MENDQISFSDFLDEKTKEKLTFTEFLDNKLNQEPLKIERPDIYAQARMKATEREASPQWYDKFTPLVNRALGGFYGSAASTTAALADAAKWGSEKLGIPKGGLFDKLTADYTHRKEYLRQRGMKGVAGEVASGVGSAAFDIPSIMAFGQYGLPIHGALMGAAKEGLPGAVKGGIQGALVHKTLQGIGQLPSKLRLPAFFGFGAGTTPGGIKERVTGGLTWTALGLSGGNKRITWGEFKSNYPKIQEKLTENKSRRILKALAPEISAKEIKQSGGAKNILDESVRIAEETFKEKTGKPKTPEMIAREKEIIRMKKIGEKIAKGEKPTIEEMWEEEPVDAEMRAKGKKEMADWALKELQEPSGEPIKPIEPRTEITPTKGKGIPGQRALELKKELGERGITEPKSTKEMFAGLPVTVETKGKVKQLAHKLIDSVQIEPQFKRLGAPDTGIQIKAFHSIKNAAIEKAEVTIRKISKRFERKGLKIQKKKNIPRGDDFQELTYVSASDKRFNDLPPQDKQRLAEPRAIVRKFFGDWEVKLKKAGVFETGFPDSAINQMREDRVHLNIALKDKKLSDASKEKIHKDINEINETLKFLSKAKIQYVHIPRTWLQGLFVKDSGKARQIITQFFRERKTFDMEELGKHLVKKGYMKPEELDIRRIMGAYAHQAGHKIALARIFQSAEKEGLIKTEGKAEDNWQYLPSREYPSLKGKKVHPVFAEFFEKNFTRGQKIPTKYMKMWMETMGVTKMLQFYNPVFLPMYDVVQAWWSGSVRSKHTPKNIFSAFKSMLKKDKAYWDMHEEGGFSTPFTPGFEQHMKRVKRLVDSHSFFKRAKKYINPYQLSWKMAWSGDHLIRMITYHHYLNKGMTSRDAAQVTAKLHGDYASIPPKMRRTLNKIFFTPSFKIAMTAAQTEMVLSSGKLLAKAGKVSGKEKAMAKAMVGLASGIMLREVIMHKLGFKTDKFGLKYTKSIDTDEGKKELVLHAASPDNVIARFLHRFNPKNLVTEPDKFHAIVDRSKWEFHPLYQLGYEILSNKSVTLEPIWNSFDTPAEISKDVALYTLKRLVRMTEMIKGMGESPKRLEAQKQLYKDLGKVGVLLNWFTLPYLRNPVEKRVYWKVQRVKQLFKQEMKDKPPNSAEEVDKRLDNFQKRIESLMRELKK